MATSKSKAGEPAKQVHGPIEWKVAAKTTPTACRFCGAPVVFGRDGARIRCLDARTIRVLSGKRGRMAQQHRCIAGGGGRG